VAIELRNIDEAVASILPHSFILNVYLRPCIEGEKIEASE